MTMVISFSAGGCPFMVGDLLTSSHNKPSRPTSVPSVGKVTVLDDAANLRHPAGLKQKIVVVNNCLCIGWSGPVLHAEIFFNELQFQSQLVDSDAKSVEIAIDKILEENDCSNLQIIALFENNGTVTRFSRNAEVFNGNSLGDLVCIGSGTNQAIDVLRETASSMPDVLQNATALDGLKVALALVGGMHAREVAGMQTIVDSFGGGTEICYFTDEGLKKLDNLAFVYVEFEQVNGKIMYAPLSFSNQYYVDHDLIIYTVRLQTGVPKPTNGSSLGHFSNLRREAYIVIPPNKMVGAIRTEQIVQSLHFDYEFICTCFIDKSGGDCFVDVKSADIGGWMRITQNGQSQLKFEINSEKFRQYDEILKTTQ